MADLLEELFTKFDFGNKWLIILYLFPIATVTNCHKFNGLKQHKFMMLQFCGSYFQNGSCGLKIVVSAQLCYFGRLQGKLFAIRGFLHSLACGPFLHLYNTVFYPIFFPQEWFIFISFKNHFKILYSNNECT